MFKKLMPKIYQKSQNNKEFLDLEKVTSTADQELINDINLILYFKKGIYLGRGIYVFINISIIIFAMIICAIAIPNQMHNGEVYGYIILGSILGYSVIGIMIKNSFPRGKQWMKLKETVAKVEDESYFGRKIYCSNSPGFYSLGIQKNLNKIAYLLIEKHIQEAKTKTQAVSND